MTEHEFRMIMEKFDELGTIMHINEKLDFALKEIERLKYHQRYLIGAATGILIVINFFISL